MEMIQRPCTHGLVLLCAVGVLGIFGCGKGTALRAGTTSTGGAADPGMSPAGGRDGIPSAASSGGSASASQSGERCSAETPVAAPTVSKDCTVSLRNVDPIFTCGQTDCAVRRAFDLTCETLPRSPSLSATAEGSTLFSITRSARNDSATAHLLTVNAAGSRVEDVAALNGFFWDSVLKSESSSSSSGKAWVFAQEGSSVMAAHASGSRWARSRIPIKLNSGTYISARMIDDNLGYLAYGIDSDGYAPHLVTWDGSCWTDQALAARATPDSTVVAVDENQQPWVAWKIGTEALYLRSPSGDTQDLLANLAGDAQVPTAVGDFRLLPGGLDGSSTFPLVAGKTRDGILLFSRKETEPEWRSVVLPHPEAAGIVGDGCPVGPGPSDCLGDPCLGVTSCKADVSAAGSGFDLVRTQSGRTFAAQIVYSSQGSYTLKTVRYGAEFPTCSCGWTETSGSGTADLLLLRLTEAEPSVSHFRFDMGGATADTTRDLVLAARGDTLVVAAQLSGSRVPTLTYIEIDSTRLP